MKILVDTNILFSAVLFPHSKLVAALLHAAEYHHIVLCDRNLFELRDILNRKAPSTLPDAEVLLAFHSFFLPYLQIRYLLQNKTPYTFV